jgi:hypothetical protein
MRELRIGRFRKEIRIFARLGTAEGIELKHLEEIQDKKISSIHSMKALELRVFDETRLKVGQNRLCSLRFL